MTQTVFPPPPTAGAPTAVTGDGTTARTRVRRRWRAARWTLGIAGVVVLVAVVLGLLQAPTSGTPFAPDNPAPAGAQALARILGDHGVHVTYTRSVADAVRHASPGTTLAVFPGTGARELDTHDLRALAHTKADLALLGPSEGLLAATAPELSPAYAWNDAGVTTGAGCTDPDALAAGVVSTDATGFLPTTPGDARVTTCFRPSGAPSDAGSYAVVDAGRRVAAFDDATFTSNGYLAAHGNAALAVRMLGRHAELVWLVPDPGAAASSDDGGSASISDLVPAWFWWVGAWALVVAVLAIWWRGRRLGALVPEDLPVVVRSSETTRGRGRLYRVGGARGHAAAGLRAAAIDRMARLLGLPRSAQPPAVIDAVARASEWEPPLVAEILYGPPPHDDAALLRLARLVDDLESEVHP